MSPVSVPVPVLGIGLCGADVSRQKFLNEEPTSLAEDSGSTLCVQSASDG